MFFATDDFTEELLNQHEAEVQTLKKYYEDHKDLFEGVTKWQENWTLYLELDVSNCLVYFFWGGGIKDELLVFLCLLMDVLSILLEKG